MFWKSGGLPALSSTERIIEYLGLEGTHKEHQVQHLMFKPKSIPTKKILITSVPESSTFNQIISSLERTCKGYKSPGAKVRLF